MDGMTLLQDARAVGLTVTADGDRLTIRGPRRADPVAKQLIAHKPAVLNALRGAELPAPTPDILPSDLPADWHFEWDERAAIMEEGCKIPKEHAEALALADILRRMREAGVRIPRNDT